ncbi:MAG: SpoVG family protein [Candidatus Brocadiia bacterium]
MEVTEIRVKLAGDPDDKLKAFCTVTFDNCFVVRDLKVIKGTKGSFVAMPSRKLSDSCPRCGGKNHLRARYCNDCGSGLSPDRAERDEKGRAKLHADVAHPIHSAYREELQRRVLEAYDEEVERARRPGYQALDDEYFEAPDDSYQADDSPGDEDGPPPPPPNNKGHDPHRFGEGILP